MNTLKITLNDDGTVSIDARGMKGSADSILKELNALARTLGGELKVEKHVHGAHTHSHGNDHTHSHS